MRKLLRRLSSIVRSRRLAADLAEELQFHQAMKQQELERDGLPPNDAHLAARAALGNVTMAQEDSRAVWVWPWLESVWQDIRYACRSLRRQPGFSIVAIGILSVGIGLDSSLFAVFNAAALRPWAVNDASRVVNVYRLASGVPVGANNAIGFSIAEARVLDASSRTMNGIFAMRQAEMRFDSDTIAAHTMIVTGNYFRVLGVEMERGRGFVPEEDSDHAPEPVAVLSYSSWQTRFGGDPEIVGRRIRLDEVPATVIGVTSRDFAGTATLKTDVWIPFESLRQFHPLDTSIAELLTSPTHCCSAVAGRLGRETSVQQAQAEIELLSRRFNGDHARTPKDLRVIGVQMTGTAPLSNPGAKTSARTGVVMMLIGLVLVLLLACANVGNLLIARAAMRQREIATRLSIGASRPRIVRQLLTESLVLASIAASLGVGIAYILPPYVLTHAVDYPINLRVTPDAVVLVFSIALSVVACIAVGLAPSLHASRAGLIGAVKEAGAMSRLRLRSVLLSTQVAASVVLLVAAGLMVRGLQHAYTVNPGFPTAALSVVSFDLPAQGYDTARKRALILDLRSALDSLPDFKRYGLARTAPFANAHWFAGVRFPSEDKNTAVETQEIGGQYFDVLGLALLAGRDFGPSDVDARAVLVNETLARRHFGSTNPIGRAIVMGTKPSEIVGIVKDAYTTGLEAIEPLIYQPVSGFEMPRLVIRDLSEADRQAIAVAAAGLDPRIHVHAEPLSAQLDRYLSPARTAAALAGILGLLALGLTCVGMFGVFAYLVRQRTQEIGVRMALGARSRQIIAMVVASGGRSVLMGLVLGLLASAVLSQGMQSLLYGLSRLDVRAYAGACVVVVISAAAATWIPARRAIRLDPVKALRCD